MQKLKIMSEEELQEIKKDIRKLNIFLTVILLFFTLLFRFVILKS